MFKKKNDQVAEGDAVIQEKNDKPLLPYLMFCIGLLLIVAGTLFQLGWFGNSEAVPVQEAKTEEKEETEEDTDKTEKGETIDVTSGVAFVLDPTATYNYENGLLTINAKAVTSTCDSTGSVCGLATDTVSLNVVDSTGTESPLTFTVNNASVVFGDYTIAVSKWDDGVVYLTIIGGSSSNDNTTNGTTTNGNTTNTTGTTNNGTSTDNTTNGTTTNGSAQ